MINPTLDPLVTQFCDRVSDIIGISHNTHLDDHSVIIDFKSGFLFKKYFAKVSQSDGLVGIDVYVENIKESKVKEIEHIVGHLKKDLKNKKIDLVFNKVFI